ncbi:MAG: hypothetical protein K0U38_01875 [Epsilonproteobacteria bacterium]|nr:hypothetical protein [Campylobacterota bacterium]
MSRESKISIAILLLGFIGIITYWFNDSGVEQKNSTLIKERIVLPNHDADIYQNVPEVKSYIDDVKKHLAKGEAVLPLDSSELDSKGVKAQALLLKDREFLKDTISFDGKLQHNDMMTIRPAITSVMSSNTQQICQTHTCYQALKYNFVSNTTTRAVVDVDNEKILEIKRFPDMQPDISLRLTHVAQAIALYAPEVKKELGENPSFKDMSMANVRGSINGSPCENADHLCVAPTFSYHEKEEALWAIIDLTDMKLAAAKWAGLGKTTTPSCISERSLQNRQIMENFCQKDTLHEEDDWRLSYRITGSDGLEVINASFKGQEVLTSAKVVDWHVSYKAKEGASTLDTSTDTYVEGRRVEYVKGDNDEFFFGYNDAMGCPMFSTSVVLPFNAPRVKALYKGDKKVGFYLLQDYRNPKWPMACNYRYENRFEFYNDGSFRVVGVNKGRGCGKNALYRPVMRIDMALSDKEEFYKYDGAWKKWSVEGSDFQNDAKVYDNDRYLYKIVKQGSKQGYYIEPNRGQFGDKSRGDNATLFTTLYKEGEGEQDLLTLGSCCKLSEDGVERYLEKTESIDGENIVLWYVPRVKNDAREGHEYCWADTVLGEDGNLKVKVWPCSVGPKFVPILDKEI